VGRPSTLVAPEPHSIYRDLEFIEEVYKGAVRHYKCHCACGNTVLILPKCWGSQRGCSLRCTNRLPVNPGDMFGAWRVLLVGRLQDPFPGCTYEAAHRTAYVMCQCGYKKWMLVKNLVQSRMCTHCGSVAAARTPARRRVVEQGRIRKGFSPDTSPMGFMRRLRGTIRGVAFLVERRDRGRCVLCQADNLTAVHHGRPVSLHPSESWNPRYQGVLCQQCHNRIHNFGKWNGVNPELTEVFIAATSTLEHWFPTDARTVAAAEEGVLVIVSEQTGRANA